MFKSFSKHQKVYLAFLVILVFIVFIILLQPSQSVPVSGPIPSITPSVTSPLAPASSLPPELKLTVVNPSQKLFINWNGISLTPPNELPYYSISNPLITQDIIRSVAAKLNFTEANLKKTLKTTSTLYTKNNLSLFASTSQNQILYTNSSPIPSSTGFSDLSSIENSAGTYFSQFFNNLTFNKIQEPEYYLSQSPEQYPEKSIAEKANLVRLNYTQSISGYPLLTTATGNSIVSFTFDSEKNLRSLEITGGFQGVKEITKLKIMNFDTLKQIASRLASPLSYDAITDIVSLAQTELEVTLDLKNIQLAYFSSPDSNQAVPVFLLEGTLKGRNFSGIKASYIVPAQY